jgi:hypothetical protein
VRRGGDWCRRGEGMVSHARARSTSTQVRSLAHAMGRCDVHSPRSMCIRYDSEASASASLGYMCRREERPRVRGRAGTGPGSDFSRPSSSLFSITAERRVLIERRWRASVGHGLGMGCKRPRAGYVRVHRSIYIPGRRERAVLPSDTRTEDAHRRTEILAPPLQLADVEGCCTSGAQRYAKGCCPPRAQAQARPAV